MNDRDGVINGLDEIMHYDGEQMFYNDIFIRGIADNALAMLKEQERQLNEYHKADTFLAVHGFWSDNPPYGVKTSVELERP